MKYLYWLLATGSLALLAVDAPSGSLLTSEPSRGTVQAAQPNQTRGPTVRGRGPAFIWLGGGYHGGK